jgi:hypothetical protein
MTYGLLNYACFYQAISRSPGWRPTFKFFSAGTGLCGAVLCVVAMFLTDVVWTIAAFIVAFLLWNYITFSDPDVNWGSAAEARRYMSAVKEVMRLRTVAQHAKTFRPNYLILTRDTASAAARHLVRFAHTLRRGYGVVIVGQVHAGASTTLADKALALEEDEGGYFDMRAGWAGDDGGDDRGDDFTTDASCVARLCQDTKHKAYAAFSKVQAPTLREGANMLIQAAGLGRLRPNTLLIGWKKDWRRLCSAEAGERGRDEVRGYFGILQDAARSRMGVMVARNLEIDLEQPAPSDPAVAQATVDVWWIVDDGGLSLLVPHLMMKTRYWEARTRRRGRKVRLMAVMDGDVSRINEVRMKMRTILDKYRLDWELEPVSLASDESMHGARGAGGDGCGPSKTTVAAYNGLPGVEKAQEQAKSEWVLRWLRVAELVSDYSENAACVYLTLPFPRSWVDPINYMGWLEILGRQKAPVVFIRGNGRQGCLTHLSE